SGTYSTKVSVHKGELDLDGQFLTGDHVSFETRLDSERLQMTQIPTAKIANGLVMTIILADRQYPEQYRFAVAASVNIRSSCIVSFDYPHAEGSFSVVPDCRLH